MYFEMTYQGGKLEHQPLQRRKLLARLKLLWKASRGKPPHYDLVKIVNKRLAEKRAIHRALRSGQHGETQP